MCHILYGIVSTGQVSGVFFMDQVMDSGWIKAHRRMRDNLVWKEKPFSPGQAWMDILFRVNHADNKFRFGNELIEVKIGSMITSIRKLGDSWGWSRTKVVSFLKLLEQDKMLSVNSDTKKTVLTVVNYSVYQHCEDTEKPQKSHASATRVPREDTNKNVKNVKNEKKEKKILAQRDEIPLSQPHQEPIFLIPLVIKNNNGDPTLYPVYQDKISEWQESYPGIDIMAELKKCRQWNIDNPKNRKTENGILRHINNWLSRTQNKATKQPTKPKSSSIIPDNVRDWDNEDPFAK